MAKVLTADTHDLQILFFSLTLSKHFPPNHQWFSFLTFFLSLRGTLIWSLVNKLAQIELPDRAPTPINLFNFLPRDWPRFLLKIVCGHTGTYMARYESPQATRITRKSGKNTSSRIFSLYFLGRKTFQSNVAPEMFIFCSFGQDFPQVGLKMLVGKLFHRLAGLRALDTLSKEGWGWASWSQLQKY